jgi:histidinol-phosphate phosphatase family protein
MSPWNIDASWCLFLDRDGVINTRKIGGYIQTVEEFEFLDGADDVIAELSTTFNHVFVVTNQQGIGKGLMTEQNLLDIHSYMTKQVELKGGRITKCYYAPDLHGENNLLRKPNIGMGLLAKEEYPDVDFSKSVMIGDSDTDIEFGIKLGMKTVRIVDGEKIVTPADLSVNSLEEFKMWIQKKKHE